MATACRLRTHSSSSTFSLSCVLGAFSLALFLWALARQAFTHLASISKNEHHTYRLLYKNVLGIPSYACFFFFFFLCLDTDLTLELEERFSTSASHPWHSQPDSLLSVSGIPSPGYPRKPSAWPSLCPWDTVADMVPHMLRSTQGEFYKKSTQEELRKTYAGLWQWPQLSR